MVNILIDPVIIVLPPENAATQNVERWLENLTLWLNQALEAPFTWFYCDEATNLLQANEQFPNFNQLRQLIIKHHLDINPTQIASKINAFFRSEDLRLEHHLNQLDFVIEAEDGTITIDPEQFISRLPDYLQEYLPSLLTNCCACKELGHALGQELNVATLALADHAREIKVSLGIRESLPDLSHLTDCILTHAFPLVVTPDDLIPLSDTIELWEQDEPGIRYAIRQQTNQQGQAAPPPLEFCLGPHFIESVNERGLDTNEILLRSFFQAASDIILGRASHRRGYKLHELRKSTAANSPQRIRESDQAKAWRLMLQQHGAGWRLHYWQIPTRNGSMIEFSNICKESEHEIY